MFSPKSGKRNSVLLKNSADPPGGKPVFESRGPAWFSGKPRCERLPPPKNRSAIGMGSVGSARKGILKAGRTPNVVCRATTNLGRKRLYEIGRASCRER